MLIELIIDNAAKEKSGTNKTSRRSSRLLKKIQTDQTTETNDSSKKGILVFSAKATGK